MNLRVTDPGCFGLKRNYLRRPGALSLYTQSSLYTGLCRSRSDCLNLEEINTFTLNQRAKRDHGLLCK